MIAPAYLADRIAMAPSSDEDTVMGERRYETYSWLETVLQYHDNNAAFRNTTEAQSNAFLASSDYYLFSFCNTSTLPHTQLLVFRVRSIFLFYTGLSILGENPTHLLNDFVDLVAGRSKLHLFS